LIPDLDPRSPVPLYVQIVEHVRRLVALGALKAGDRFLTVRELAVRARVNRNTAARAIAHLEREGVVRTRVGQGTYIVDGQSPMAAHERDEALNAAIDKLVVEAHALGVPPEELGWRLHRKLEEFARARRDGDKEKA
jgi:GntR family transcriptional regulator